MTPTQTSPARRAARSKEPAKKPAKRAQAKPVEAAPVSRRVRKKERTRQRIYEAAMALFTERGFDNVTIEEICEAADVAKATFFLHFRTKASLIYETAARTTDLLREELKRPSESAREDLERLTRVMFEHWSARHEVMEAMLREFLGTPLSEISARPENEDFVNVFAEIFRRGQKNGEFRKDVLPELAGVSFFATTSTIAAVHAQKMPGADLMPFISQYLSMVLDGLVSPKARADKAGR